MPSDRHTCSTLSDIASEAVADDGRGEHCPGSDDIPSDGGSPNGSFVTGRLSPGDAADEESPDERRVLL